MSSVLTPSFLSPVHLLLYYMLYIHNKQAFTYPRYLQNEVISTMQCKDKPTDWLAVMFLSTMYIAQLLVSNCILKGPKTCPCKKLHINLHNQILTLAINVILQERAQKNLMFIMFNFNYFLELLSKTTSVNICINNITAARF